MLRGLAPAVLCAIALGATVQADSGPAAAPALALDVLTTTSALPDTTRDVLVREASRIWDRAGVTLRWPRPVGYTAHGNTFLRALVTERDLSDNTAADAGWPVGELLPATVQGEGVVALVSLGAARQVLTVAGHGEEPARLGHHRLGIVLGRALAHEIGHLLLGRHHAAFGLMRARIDARDFADLRDEGFAVQGSGPISVTAEAVLAMRQKRP